jgi:hypothetical protein
MSNNSQTNTTRRKHHIDLEKFYKKLETYVNGTFAFSKGELSETIEELTLLVRARVTEEEILPPTYDLEKLYNSCECVPLKEYARDYDRGFHQAMTLVRGWIKQGKSP